MSKRKRIRIQFEKTDKKKLWDFWGVVQKEKEKMLKKQMILIYSLNTCEFYKPIKKSLQNDIEEGIYDALNG